MTGKRIALSFTVDAPMWGCAGGMVVRAATGGNFDLILYEGTTVKATFPVDSNTLHADAQSNWVDFSFPDVALTVGNTYYIAVVPTTTALVRVYRYVTPATGQLSAFAGSCRTAIWTDSAWGTPLATEMPFGYVGISAFDDGAGGGGGVGSRIAGGLVRVA